MEFSNRSSAPATGTPLVSFVVPLYFTGIGVVKLLDEFRNLPVPEGYEVVLVNDGSRDDTMKHATAAVATMPIPVTLVDLARNFGEHAATLEGFRHSRGEYVICLDDDLQNPVSEALRLLAHIRSTDADVVYAYYEEKKHHWFRNLGSRVNSWMATWLLDKPKNLYLCSFRAHSRALVDRISAYTGPYPYIDGLILSSTNRIERLLVKHEERADGQSGYTLRKLVRLWMNMFFNFSIMPLRVASLLGGMICGVGLFLLAWVLIEHYFAGVRQSGWASTISAISIFSGAQLLILGLLGEYVGRAYMTLSGKPQSLVRSVAQHRPARQLLAGELERKS
ncbi:MAG TPA: glycosyltransferase family 2 protein [Verrucomicrobiaceae bacterium]|jgi:undecaprenyl-phosphate 4-deoxy-4-formamido-L-arabinose transferase